MSFLGYLKDVSSLSCVQRFSQEHLTKPENVLEHTGFAAHLCVFIGQKLRLGGSDVAMEELVLKALYHDFDEIITGDIARPIKYDSQELRCLIGKLESRSMKALSDKYDLDDFLHYYWENSKKEKEGIIVSLADCICSLCKFHNEICARGNKAMGRLFNEDVIDAIHDKLFLIENAFGMKDASFLSEISRGCIKMADEIKGELK